MTASLTLKLDLVTIARLEGLERAHEPELRARVGGKENASGAPLDLIVQGENANDGRDSVNVVARARSVADPVLPHR